MAIEWIDSVSLNLERSLGNEIGETEPFALTGIANTMKVLHLSTADTGGAGRATYRLHQSLRAASVDSTMLVNRKTSDDPAVIPVGGRFRKAINLLKLPERLDQLPLVQYPQRPPGIFSTQWFPDVLLASIQRMNPDIINLNWVGKGYLQLETLSKLKKPLLWTLMDMGPFTGGCFYAQACDRYTQSCGRCPQLGSDRPQDLSHQLWQRKARAWKSLNLTIVSPSHWLADCARASSLFKDLPIEVIPFGLNTQKYQPIDQSEARRALNLPQHKQLVLFGAMRATDDPRKGFQLLQPALKRLSQSDWQDRLELVVFGASAPATPVDLGFRTHYLGHLHDDVSLALAYSAADVMVTPSLQEAFGQTGTEALACGTPVVAFAQTGLADIVEHQRTGFLATPFEVEDLANGIAWVLSDPDRYLRLREQSRRRAESEFAAEIQAERYVNLFQRICEPQDLRSEINSSPSTAFATK